MARPSKPATVIQYEKKSHRTKAEIEKRKEEEAKLLTGEKLKERKEVREDGVAHEEFVRVRGLLRKIEKNDGLYDGIINRYAQLYSECRDFEEKRKSFHDMLLELRERRDELLAEEGATLMEYFRMQADLEKQVIALDRQIQNKRKMMLAIEKENAMTIASALRSIPKRSGGTDDDLVQALKGSG